jgi:hypothetical protein
MSALLTRVEGTKEMITGEDLWLDRVRVRLAGGGASKELIDAVAAEAREHCAMSGERPEAAFGEPDKYARAVIVALHAVHVMRGPKDTGGRSSRGRGASRRQWEQARRRRSCCCPSCGRPSFRHR